MTALDILLLLPLGIGAVKGYRRGLVLEVVSLLAFVLAVVGGLMLLSAAVPLVRQYVGDAFGMLPLLSPGLVAGSQVLPIVQQATPLALQITGYVLPFAQDLLGRMRAAFVKG